MALDHDGNLLIASSQETRRLDLDSGTTTRVHGGSAFIEALAVDREGTVYFTSTPRPGETAAVMKISADGSVSVVFGAVAGRYGGVFSESLDGLAVASDGTLYVADNNFGRLVRITSDGVASMLLDRDTFEGRQSFQPAAILSTPDGSLLVSETGQHSIWRVTIDE